MYLKFKMLHNANYNFDRWIIRKINSIQIAKTSAFCHIDLYEFTLIDTTISEQYQMLSELIPGTPKEKKSRDDFSYEHYPYFMGLFKTLERAEKELKQIEDCLLNNINFYQINTYEYWKDNKAEKKLCEKYLETIDIKDIYEY